MIKCVCGYIKKQKWELKDEGCPDVDKEFWGTPEFIGIEGSFHKVIDNFREVRVYLKACPECGTIKMVE